MVNRAHISPIVPILIHAASLAAEDHRRASDNVSMEVSANLAVHLIKKYELSLATMRHVPILRNVTISTHAAQHAAEERRNVRNNVSTEIWEMQVVNFKTCTTHGDVTITHVPTILIVAIMENAAQHVTMESKRASGHVSMELLETLVARLKMNIKKLCAIINHVLNYKIVKISVNVLQLVEVARESVNGSASTDGLEMLAVRHI